MSYKDQRTGSIRGLSMTLISTLRNLYTHMFERFFRHDLSTIKN